MAQFETGHSYLGPHIGISGLGGAVSVGGDYEYAITKSGDVGSGRIGVGATFDYFSWSYADDWSYSVIPLGVFGAYHFNTSNRAIDPFLGCGLGYFIINATWNGNNETGGPRPTASYTSDVYLNLVGGVRYFITPSFAAQARVGLGATWLSLGATFAL